MNPFLRLSQIAQEAWNEHKGLDWTPDKGGKRRHVKRLEKSVEELEELIPKLKQEIELIRHINQL